MAPPFTAEELAAEEWRPLPEWDPYEVSNLGRVRRRSLDRRGGYDRPPYTKIHLGRVNGSRSGYRMHWVQRGARRLNVGVHVLVLLAFVGPRPTGMHACHYDCNPQNNRLSNLRWDTPLGNMMDSVRLGRVPMPKRLRATAPEVWTKAEQVPLFAAA
jgi:hypothetical protein